VIDGVHSAIVFDRPWEVYVDLSIVFAIALVFAVAATRRFR
jgi:hypothetical protein